MASVFGILGLFLGKRSRITVLFFSFCGLTTLPLFYKYVQARGTIHQAHVDQNPGKSVPEPSVDFLRLPPEMRLLIYEHMQTMQKRERDEMRDETRSKLSSSSSSLQDLPDRPPRAMFPLQVLLACKQLYVEGRDFSFRSETFFIQDLFVAEDLFVQYRLPMIAREMRHVALGVNEPFWYFTDRWMNFLRSLSLLPNLRSFRIIISGGMARVLQSRVRHAALYIWPLQLDDYFRFDAGTARKIVVDVPHGHQSLAAELAAMEPRFRVETREPVCHTGRDCHFTQWPLRTLSRPGWRPKGGLTGNLMVLPDGSTSTQAQTDYLYSFQECLNCDYIHVVQHSRWGNSDCPDWGSILNPAFNTYLYFPSGPW